VRGPTKPTTPLKIVFLTTGSMFTGVVANGYATSPTTLTIKRDGTDTVLVLDRPAVADESLCDDSGGSWTDDEADPSTVASSLRVSDKEKTSWSASSQSPRLAPKFVACGANG
jgi:hypothetical protein